MLEILMVCPQFTPVIGGYEKAAERLSGALVRDGHSVTVFTDRHVLSSPKKEILDDFRVRRLPTFASFRRLFFLDIPLKFLVFTVYLLFNVRRFDVIHVHQYGYHSTITILVAGFFRIPVLMKVTNTAEQGIASTMAKRPRIGAFVLETHKRVDGWFAPSPETMEEVKSLGISESRIYQIPNGVDSETFRPVMKEERDRAKQAQGAVPGPLFLFMGRLSGEKNLEMLVRAWSRSRRTDDGSKLAIVGRGALRDELQELVRELGCEDSILMPGAVSDPLPWYAASDVFVLSSDNEGLSNSLLEAMSCGLPVISTRVSGSVGIFASAPVGRMVEVGDEEAFAAAIEEMRTDRDFRDRCGAAARELAESHFSLGVVARNVAVAYRELIENASSRSSA